MPNGPAMKRRIVFYDLNDTERSLLKDFADEDGRTVSRWVADAVRDALRIRLAEEQARGKR